MSALNRASEVDLLGSVDDLGLVITANWKRTDIINLIKECECHDEDFLKDRLEETNSERKERLQIGERKFQA